MELQRVGLEQDQAKREREFFVCLSSMSQRTRFLLASCSCIRNGDLLLQTAQQRWKALQVQRMKSTVSATEVQRGFALLRSHPPQVKEEGHPLHMALSVVIIILLWRGWVRPVVLGLVAAYVWPDILLHQFATRRGQSAESDDCLAYSAGELEKGVESTEDLQ